MTSPAETTSERKPDWREMTLGQFITLQRGHDLTESERRMGNVPVMGSAGVNGTHDTAKATGPGVVIGRSGGSFGQVHYCTKDFWPHNTALYVTNYHGNDVRFAYYLLKFINFDGFNSGSAQPSLNRNFVYPIRIQAPEPDEQRAVASVLGSLDDKIELNRRMNCTLEELAAALFRSWFVDFDPVVAKLAGRKPSHLRPDLASLFPSHWEDSPLGPIPRGWRVGKVEELASLTRGGINPGEFPLETFDHYSIPAFDVGRFPKPELGGTIKSNKFPVPPGCVMISKLNPDTPRVWLPQVTGERRAVCSTEFLVSTPKPPATKEFLFGLFSSEAFISSFAMLVTGTSKSHQRVKPDGLLTTEVVIPGEPLLSAFTKLTQPWLAQITHNIGASRTLAALRDALLPKLISGELRVKQAEKAVEGAL